MMCVLNFKYMDYWRTLHALGGYSNSVKISVTDEKIEEHIFFVIITLFVKEVDGHFQKRQPHATKEDKPLVSDE